MLARPAQGEVSSPFGWRWNYTDWHGGVDFAGPVGAPVLAADSGTVVNVWPNGAMSKYGRTIVLAHDKPTGSATHSLYAHLSASQVVKGQRVQKGQRIGSIGTTAASSGDAERTVPPHLHFELLNRWPPPASDVGRLDPTYALGIQGPGSGLGPVVVAAFFGLWLWSRKRGRA